MNRYVYATQQPQVALTNYGHQVAHLSGQAHLHPQPQVYYSQAAPGYPQRASVVQASTLEIPPCPQPDPITVHIQPPRPVQGPPRLVSADTAMLQHPRQVPCGPVYGAYQQPQVYQSAVVQSPPAIVPVVTDIYGKGYGVM